MQSVEAPVQRSRAHEVRPRVIRFAPPEDAPKYWAGGDPYATHLLSVLSLTFPGGEHMFVESVRAFRDQLRDPVLRQQVRAFISQEGLHSHLHGVMNKSLARLGGDGEKIEAETTAVTKSMAARRTNLQNLALTAAFEHFTAIMGELLLTEPELRDTLSEPYRRLWLWHALEELDHKAVAFDVFQEVSGDYWVRVSWMAYTTVFFFVSSAFMQARSLVGDGVHRRPLYLARRLWDFWRPGKGYFTRLIPLYLAYYRRDFHPWERDHSELLARMERELGLSLHESKVP